MPDDKKKQNLQSAGRILIEPMPQPNIPPPTLQKPHEALIPPPTVNGTKPALGQHPMGPAFLLNHPNDFDKNVITPEGLVQGGILRGKPDPIRTT
jgi:hypothetical protein